MRRVFARRRAGLVPRLVVDLVVLALALALLAGPAGAAVDPARACLSAADAAADRHGVPRAVLRALTRTETGRTKNGALEPWAWTVNVEGQGRWFTSRADALAWAEAEQARGARSFDVGCFQVNHRWHGEHFDSVDAMFDPVANADYAARFLRELYDETGAWDRAAGFYHSRTPEFYERYSARFSRILARGDDETAPVDVADAPPPAAAEDARPGTKRVARARMVQVLAELPRTPGAVTLLFGVGRSPLTRAAGRLID